MTLGHAGVTVGLSVTRPLRAVAVSANRGGCPKPPRTSRSQEPLGSVRVSARALLCRTGSGLLLVWPSLSHTPAGPSPMPP